MQYDHGLIDTARDQFVCKMDYTQRLAMLKSLVSENDQWRSSCINLVASETRMSPLKEIKKYCRESNALLYYDAAHELGLIAGKQLPNPFDQGADVVSGSTGKSFSGPHGGLILWNDNERVQALKQSAFPGFVGTYQLSRMVALCFAACELDDFGVSFMSAVVANARELARLLTDFGLLVHGRSKGFSETNQLLLHPPAGISSHEMAKKLEAINIVCNPVVVPGKNAKALRLSTTEITRQGMGAKEIQLIARLIAALYFNRKPTSLLAKQTSQLVAGFQDIKVLLADRE